MYIYIYGGLPPGSPIGKQYSSMGRAGLLKKGPEKRAPPDVFLGPFWSPWAALGECLDDLGVPDGRLLGSLCGSICKTQNCAPV